MQSNRLHNHDDQLEKENEEEEHEIGATIILEGFVSWTVPEIIDSLVLSNAESATSEAATNGLPTKERDRCKQKTVEDRQEEGAEAAVQKQQQNPANHVQRQRSGVEDPEVVKVLHDLLELRRDVNVYVVVKAGLDAEVVGQGRPVVPPDAGRTAVSQEFSLATLEFRRFPFELLLTSLKWVKRKENFKG